LTNKPSPGNYCWTHVHQVNQNHRSVACRNKAMRHMDDATSTNTMDGSNADKGWNSRAWGCGNANLVHCDIINLCKHNYYYALLIESAPTPPSTFPHQHTGITNSGSSGFYFSCGTPIANYNPRALTIGITVANRRCPERSVASATLASVSALSSAMMMGHFIPSFPHTLIGLALSPTKAARLSLSKHLSQSSTPAATLSSKVDGTLMALGFGNSLSLLLLNLQRTRHLWLQYLWGHLPPC
jgi:hypothetical protein